MMEFKNGKVTLRCDRCRRRVYMLHRNKSVWLCGLCAGVHAEG